MKLFLSLLSLSLLTFACFDDDDSMPMETMPPSPSGTTDTISYLALGDSYTIGTSVTAAESWPAQLAAALVTSGIDDKSYTTEPDIIATNGWTTRDLINGIDARADLNEEYDMVSLLIGVNNQFQGLSIVEYRVEFEQLLNQAITFAGNDRSKVFVVSIPDYAFTGFGAGNQNISEGVRQFNSAAQEITDGYGIPFLNITPISQEGINEPELVASDNLHPSGKQYLRWVKEVVEVKVRGLLGT